MPDCTYVLLYVADPLISARFYATLLDRQPVEQSPTFAMLPMAPGMMLGLWARHTVEPRAIAATGCGELAIPVAGIPAVEELHRQWIAQGITIAQPPTAMDFGFTFVGLDPDGNRIRVFAPG